MQALDRPTDLTQTDLVWDRGCHPCDPGQSLPSLGPASVHWAAVPPSGPSSVCLWFSLYFLVVNIQPSLG